MVNPGIKAPVELQHANDSRARKLILCLNGMFFLLLIVSMLYLFINTDDKE